MSGSSQRPAPEPGAIGASEPPQAQVIDRTLAERFGGEVEQCVAVLSSGIVALESAQAGEDRWEEMMRAAHSLKGASRVVGLMEVAKLAHTLEDYFVATRAEGATLEGNDVDRLLETVDLFQSAGRATAEGDPWATAQLDRAARALREDLAATPRLAQRAPREEAEAGTFHLFSDNDNEEVVPSAEPGAAPSPDVQPETVGEQLGSVALSIAPERPRPPPQIVDIPQPAEAKVGGARKATELANKPNPAGADRVLRVSADSMDRMMGLAGESLVESRRVTTLSKALTHLKRQHRTLMETLAASERRGSSSADEVVQQARNLGKLLADYHGEFDDYMRRVEDLGERLYREALKSRMRPFSDGASGLPRLVRDVSRKLGKQVRLTIQGENTEVDRDVLEALDAPLNHILRNALDHGVEDPEERKLASKPAQAQLTVEVRHQAGMFAVTLGDDGRGIDPARIRRKVIEKGLAAQANAEALSDAELYEFLFVPGFSTASAVSEISGRGVGLDVVRTSVEALGGSVAIESLLGKGTKFKLLLPVTRSVLRALVAEVDGESFAFPLLRIERIDRVPAASVRTLEGRRYIMSNDRPLSLISARRVFGYPERAREEKTLNVVVLSDHAQRFGVIVDEFRGERDLVVRPLDPRLGKVEDIAAAAVLADGATALIVDVEDMGRTVERLMREAVASPGSNQAERGARRRVLVVDDSITVREAERQVLENRGFAVEVAVDGQEGLLAARRQSFDLIVTDIDMPRMNGLELVRALKADPRLQRIPVIVVSYKSRAEDREAGLAAGANLYLSKSSFHDERLLEAIQEVLGNAAC